MKANDKRIDGQFSFQDSQGQKHEHRPMSVTTLKGRSITGKELTIEIPRHPATAYKLSELQKHFSK